MVDGTGELRSDGSTAGEVVVRRLDTSDLSSVRTFAKEVLESEKAIHVLVSVGMTAAVRKQNEPLIIIIGIINIIIIIVIITITITIININIIVTAFVIVIFIFIIIIIIIFIILLLSRNNTD